MVFFYLLDLFFDELVSDNIVASHLCDEEHDFLDFVADILLLVFEVQVYLFDHLLLENLCFALILPDFGYLLILKVHFLLQLLDFQWEFFYLFEHLRWKFFATLLIWAFPPRIRLNALDLSLDYLCEIADFFFELSLNFFDWSL